MRSFWVLLIALPKNILRLDCYSTSEDCHSLAIRQSSSSSEILDFFFRPPKIMFRTNYIQVMSSFWCILSMLPLTTTMTANNLSELNNSNSNITWSSNSRSQFQHCTIDGLFCLPANYSRYEACKTLNTIFHRLNIVS